MVIDPTILDLDGSSHGCLYKLVVPFLGCLRNKIPTSFGSTLGSVGSMTFGTTISPYLYLNGYVSACLYPHLYVDAYM